MAKGGSDGSPNTVLIIFLVFFVLATIGLGVTTYVGFDGQNQLTQDKQAAEKKAKEQEANADWFKFQAYVGRMAGGEKLNDEDQKAFAVLKDRYDKNSLASAGDPRKEDGIKAMNTLLQHQQLKFNSKDNNFTLPYPDLVKAITKDLDTTKANLTKTQDDLKTEQGKTEELTQNLAKAQETFKKTLDQYQAAAKADLEKKLNFKENVSQRVAELGRENEDLQAKIADMTEAHTKEVTRLTKKITSLQANVDKLQFAQASAVNFFDNDQPKGKISLIDRDGTMPFINLGSADNLKTGITFSVYGVGVDGKPIAYDIVNREGKTVIGADGKPEREGKATVEVLAVLGPHNSQVKVTSVRDPSHDPILRGDLLYNPGWSPNQQQHVAITGLIDLAGEGRDELNEFLRMLEKSNIAVDAYYDLREMTVKGPGITRKTDYLILGDIPEYGGATAKEDDPRVRRRLEVEDQMHKMQREAAENGVTMVSLRKCLMLSGYRVARTNVTREGENPQTYRQPLAPKPADKPADKPPMPPDVPPKP